MTSVDLDVEAHRFDTHIDFPPSGSFSCPPYGAVPFPVYDSSAKTRRQFNFFWHQAFRHARARRIGCEPCGRRRCRGLGQNAMQLDASLCETSPSEAGCRRDHTRDARRDGLPPQPRLHHYVRRYRRGSAPPPPRTRTPQPRPPSRRIWSRVTTVQTHRRALTRNKPNVHQRYHRTSTEGRR